MRIRMKKRKSKGAIGQMKEGEDLTSPPSLHKITYTMKISTTSTKIPDVTCTTHSFQLPHEDEEGKREKEPHTTHKMNVWGCVLMLIMLY